MNVINLTYTEKQMENAEKKLPEKVLPELLGEFDAFCQVVPHADRVVFRAGHYQGFPVIIIIIVQ